MIPPSGTPITIPRPRGTAQAGIKSDESLQHAARLRELTRDTPRAMPMP